MKTIISGTDNYEGGKAGTGCAECGHEFSLGEPIVKRRVKVKYQNEEHRLEVLASCMSCSERWHEDTQESSCIWCRRELHTIRDQTNPSLGDYCGEKCRVDFHNNKRKAARTAARSIFSSQKHGAAPVGIRLWQDYYTDNETFNTDKLPWAVSYQYLAGKLGLDPTDYAAIEEGKKSINPHQILHDAGLETRRKYVPWQDIYTALRKLGHNTRSNDYTVYYDRSRFDREASLNNKYRNI